MSPENSKPEWFQMADGDTTPPLPKGRRAIRIMALATPLLVLGAGLVFAQTQDSPTAVASAVTSTAPATTDPIALPSTPAPVAASAPASNTIQVSQTSDEASSPKGHQASTPIASTPITNPGITNPGIAKPTGGGDDDGIDGENNDD